MKWLTLLVATGIICSSASAQQGTDSAAKKTDTIRVGGMIIVKKGEGKNGGHIISIGNNRDEKKKNSKVSTNWGVLDIGFSNYVDNTNYANAGSYLVNRPGSPALGKKDFELRTGKSINVNIWLFMQELSLAKRYVNLKYGLGMEMNNYRFKSSVSYKEGGVVPYSNPVAVTNQPFIFRDSISFSKNKLVAGYITVPLMLNFNTNPKDSKKAFTASFGVSAGYLVKERNKQKSSERGKWKNNGDYDLEKFKFSYQAEIGYGHVHLYGSYSPNSMYKRGLDMKPFTVGLRFSN